jgi:hypothetical protein
MLVMYSKNAGVGDETGSKASKGLRAIEMTLALNRILAHTETIITLEDTMETGHLSEVVQMVISEEELETTLEKASEKFHGMRRHWRRSRRTFTLRLNLSRIGNYRILLSSPGI